MTTTSTDWLTTNNFQHWLKHLILPCGLMVVFLLLPNPWFTFKQMFKPEVLTIKLVTKPPVKVISEPKIEIKPMIVKQPAEPAKKPLKTVKSITNPISKPTTIEPTATQPIEAVKPAQQLSEKVSTGKILLSANNRTSIDIPAEFQARTGPTKDFFIPEQEITDWFADIPYLDESVDRPTIQMRFYSEGYLGGVEKFFDKITISKTFTTQYGTKIHCALVGILAMCGWK